jgi:hypothetical protein
MGEYDINHADYQTAYKRATQRVKAKVGFFWHFSIYLVIHAFLITLFFLTGPLPGLYNYPWFVWSMAGWGIGLLFHYLGVFVCGKSNQSTLQQQMIEEEMRKMGIAPAPPQAPFPPAE